jgi:hypothetical protein
MTKSSLFPAISAAFLASLCFLPLARAQCDLSGAPITGLRAPLVNNQPVSLPYIPATGNPILTPGDGAVAAPVTPGMGGGPTLYPSQLMAPANIGQSTFRLPYNPATLSRPGQLGPSLSVPPPPSTPGADPGYMPGPQDYYAPPVTVTNINPGGGIYASAPTQRWGGQTTADFGRYKYRGTQTGDFGQGMYWGQTSQDGPYQQLPGAMPTRDLYGMRGYTQNGSTTQTYAPY